MLLDKKPPLSIQNVTSRVKNYDGCIEKFNRKYREQFASDQGKNAIETYITDLIGIRVVCLHKKDIYTIKEMLEKKFELISITDKIKEINETENIFGYEGLHLDLKFEKYQFEVQIRTIIQDAWSTIDHTIQYKKEKDIPLELRRRIYRLAAVFELADDEFNSIKEGTVKYKQDAEIKNTKTEILNIFSFMDIAEQFFPRYQFIDYKVDEFLHTEVLSINNKLTKEQFKEAIEKNIEEIKKFNEHIISQTPAYHLNPYTMIRHCLYGYNNDIYSEILYEPQKKSYDDWKKSKNTSW